MFKYAVVVVYTTIVAQEEQGGQQKTFALAPMYDSLSDAIAAAWNFAAGRASDFAKRVAKDPDTADEMWIVRSLYVKRLDLLHNVMEDCALICCTFEESYP